VEVQYPGIVQKLVVLVPPPGYQNMGVWQPSNGARGVAIPGDRPGGLVPGARLVVAEISPGLQVKGEGELAS